MARSAGAGLVTLLGDRKVEKHKVENLHRAEAVRFRSPRSGTATAIEVYLDASTRAMQLRAAIYANAGTRLGQLLVSGSVRRPRRGRWVQIQIRKTLLNARHMYWIALVGTRGKLVLRSAHGRDCHNAASFARELSGLPRRWKAKTVMTGCPTSTYVVGLANASSTPPVGGTPGGSGSGLPGGSNPPPAPPSASQTGCMLKPSACGYPDQSNTGVPAGTSLTTRTGDISVNTAGAVVQNIALTGSIEINADNVTVKDVQVTNSDASGHAIWIAPGVGGVTIEDSTIRGADAGSGAVQYAVQNSGTDTNTGLRLDMYNCATCWAGAGTLQDSYGITNGVISGSHYEPVYYGGGGGRLVISHDTLLNPEGQTAAVFGGNDYGDETGLTITNNLLAGGGYMIYGGTIGSAGASTTNVTITGNRFGRCLTAGHSDGYGYKCAGGADAHGYWPRGGYYGVAAYVGHSVTTWSGNIWDDSLASVPEP